MVNIISVANNVSCITTPYLIVLLIVLQPPS